MLLAALGAMLAWRLPNRVPSIVWIGYLVEDDAERSLPGVYVTPHGARLSGYEADYNEDTLMLLRIDRPAWIERVREVLGIGGRTPAGYRSTDRRVDEPGSRWVEFAILESR